jgi:hypothetical protein
MTRYVTAVTFLYFFKLWHNTANCRYKNNVSFQKANPK